MHLTNTERASNFHMMHRSIITLIILHFLIKHSGYPSRTDFCHQQYSFAQDRLNWTGVYAHSVGYQIELTIFEYNIFNSTTVFFTDWFGRTFRPGLNFKSSSASTKAGSLALDHGILWHIFIVYNKSFDFVPAAAERSQCDMSKILSPHDSEFC